MLALLVIVGLLVANLRRGRAGTRLLAVRSNERAAASLGVNVIAAKVYAFAVAAAIAALGGVLLAVRPAERAVHAVQRVRLGPPIQYAVVGGIAWASGQRSSALTHRARHASSEKIVAVGHRHRGVARRSSPALGAILVLRQAPDGVAAL